MHTPQGKANVSMETFAAKNVLPDQHGQVEVESSSVVLPSFLLIRRRWVLKLLKTQPVDKATGPDSLKAADAEGLKYFDGFTSAIQGSVRPLIEIFGITYLH